MTFKNFEAASRKRNMVSFGMFPATRNLSWITDNETSPTPATVAYSATPVFELANGLIQRITLTGNVTSSTFVLNGGLSIPEGTQFWLDVIQDGTGSRTFQFPATVRNPLGFIVRPNANYTTSFQFEYRSGGWDIVTAPVEGPTYVPPPVTVAYSTAPVFDIATGLIQRITLTGNVDSSTFVFNGGTSFQDGQQFWLHILQNATGGWRFVLPYAVRNPSMQGAGLDASTLTTFLFEYRNSGWDIINAPVEGPAS